jgi:hypothetical protein
VILYHGSNVEIDKIDINKCKPFKDFGRGFYTTPLKDQAFAMANRTTRIFREGKPCVTEFFCDDNLVGLEKSFEAVSFNIKRFDEPSIEWARFVINNRNHKFTDIQSLECNIDGKYDIVTGPVANDDITALVDVYLSGILSDEVLAKELTFRDLSIQVSFHTEKSINCLRKTRVYYE